jgi:colanic acid/amylovoran biosynthesis protein
MLIEIRRAGFINKGAQLMLLAIRQELERRYPHLECAIAPTRNSAEQPIGKIREYGFLLKSSLWRAGVQWGDLAGAVPRALRRAAGVVLDREIDVVLDAAGFAYGSPWVDAALEDLARCARRWRRQGTGLVLLPQAFGRFDTPHRRELINEIVAAADRVYARDAQSLAHLHEAVGERPQVSLSPDFTALAHAPEAALSTMKGPRSMSPERTARLAETIVIIPNARMLDQTATAVREEYLPFLRACLQALRERGLPVIFLIHAGGEDRSIIVALGDDARAVPVVEDDDPLRLKAVLAGCRGVIGSRFHGLVSALSAGVPAFGTSWSHKYRALYADYDFAQGLVGDLHSARAGEMVALLADDAWQSRTRAHLIAQAAAQRALIERMWQDTSAIIETAVVRRHR